MTAAAPLATAPCQASPLLLPGAEDEMTEVAADYPTNTDETLHEVHGRLQRGFATKMDLSALIGWKHVNNARWMTTLFELPPGEVEEKTKAAFADGLTDADRVTALAGLPGFGGNGAFSSVLLCAWSPDEFGVYDRLAGGLGWDHAVSPACVCHRSSLPVYFAHLRRMATELGDGWTPRNVDIALYELGRRYESQR